MDGPGCVGHIPGQLAASCIQRIPRDGATPDATTVYDLILQAESQAAFPPVDIQLLPRLALPDGRAANIVGIPTWFWLTTDTWHPITLHAAAGPVWVNVTATPSALSIFTGDGTAIACNGPGTPLTNHHDAMNGSPDCGHTYHTVSTHQPTGAYTITTAITWTITWHASTGQSGITEPATTQNTTPYVLRQARAHLIG